jgi:CheY-like chemotaxis protein
MARILLIDDNADLRQMVAHMLETAGHEVFQAADGEEGIVLHGRILPQLVITDLLMPGKEGIETIMALKRDRPHVKILAISGGGRSGAIDILEMAHRLGADRTLTKPFRKAEVLDAVARLLEC